MASSIRSESGKLAVLVDNFPFLVSYVEFFHELTEEDDLRLAITKMLGRALSSEKRILGLAKRVIEQGCPK